jgi:hypothetical protein
MRGRKDANHEEFKRALIEAHLSVVDLAEVPANVPGLANLPDLLVGGFHQQLGVPYAVLMEIKTASGAVRPGQSDFAAAWRGPVAVVRNRREALALFGIEVE